MHLINPIFRTVFIVLIAYGCASQAVPLDKNSAKLPVTKSRSLLQSYHWYDGDQKRIVWLDQSLVAEMGHSSSSSSSKLLRSYPGAVLRHTHNNVRIWQQPAAQVFSMPQLKSKQSPGTKSLTYSRVFHDVSTTSGRMRALPGNIIVYLDANWSVSKVTQWMQTRGFEVVKKINIRPNAFIIKTEPGMEALQTANALYESGEVIAAFPDWWLESVMR